MPTRKANAVWEGGLKSGKGSFTGASGKIGGSYSFGTRFGEEAGTNPEELLAAAEAACYSMALSLGLEQNGTPPNSVRTTAECTISPDSGGFTITTMKLTVRADVPGVDADTFQKLAEGTKDGCPVSKAFKGNLKFELDAKLD